MARTSKYKPGDTSIDDVEPKKQASGRWVIRWRRWDYDGGVMDYRTSGATRGAALRAARTKAAELDAGTAGGGGWTKASRTGDYLRDVVRPAIETSSKLADDTKSLYGRSVTIIDGEIGKLPIAKAIDLRTAEKCLQTIAAGHGSQSAKTARNVLNRWVYGQMKRDKLLVQSPLAGVDIDLGTNKTTTKPANDVALAEVDYDRLLDHLLAFDAATVVLPPRSRPEKRAKVAGVVAITMLQMTTGMRLGTVRQVQPHEIIDNTNGGVNIAMPAEKIKGKRRGVTWTVLDDRVAERVRTLRDATPAGSYVFGAPADHTKIWDRNNCNKAIAAVYTSLADELSIEELRTEVRSHGWRTTLNSIYFWLPTHVRAEWFGHTESVNAAHYVAAEMDLSPMVAAAQERRRKATEASTLESTLE